MNKQVFDSPDDINTVELRIRTVSGNLSPVIYANGRNQLPVEVIAKALKTDGVGKITILHFSDETWRKILSLRMAETDAVLCREGQSGWCFTDISNEYSLEVVNTEATRDPVSPALISESDEGATIVTMYIYTTEINMKRIAVSIDTPQGKHFTTADSPEGAEKSSVSVNAIETMQYIVDKLNVQTAAGLGHTTVPLKLYFGRANGLDTYPIKAYYDNIYITIQHQYRHYFIHGYGNGKDYPYRIAAYWTNHDNQHMLVANPENPASSQNRVGFQGKAFWYNFGDNLHYEAVYNLFQTFEYEENKSICWTHFCFEASEHWPLPDNLGLHVNDTGLQEFDCESWFEFYDMYGNYGKFTIRYNRSNQKIEIFER